MNGEDSFEAVQYVPVLKTDFIMKTTLDKELCNTLIELAGQKRRTGWHLQKDKDAWPYLQRVSAKVEHCISTRLNYPHFNKRKPASMKRNGMQFVVAMYNAWISFYDNNSFVHPHCHEEAPNFYSIAAYLSTGDSDTSLSFVCKQGDLVIFPSNLYHYTNDTSDGRIVLSGNYYAGYMPNINMGEG